MNKPTSPAYTKRTPLLVNAPQAQGWVEPLLQSERLCRCSPPGFSPIWTSQGEQRHTLHQQGPARDPCGTRYMLYSTSYMFIPGAAWGCVGTSDLTPTPGGSVILVPADERDGGAWGPPGLGRHSLGSVVTMSGGWIAETEEVGVSQ
ncbi:unnamed protein product [Boreogadus saida]